MSHPYSGNNWPYLPLLNASEDIITYFTFSTSDISLITKQRGDYNRLGFGLQLCALRFLGFAPDELTLAPKSTIDYVAKQLKVSSETLKEYGSRPFTRTIHSQDIQKYLGFRKANKTDLTRLASWLLDRALEHDKPSLLFQLAREKMQQEKIVRPGVSTLERMVATARSLAQRETYNRLKPLMTKDCCTFLVGDTMNSVFYGNCVRDFAQAISIFHRAADMLIQKPTLFRQRNGLSCVRKCAVKCRPQKMAISVCESVKKGWTY